MIFLSSFFGAYHQHFSRPGLIVSCEREDMATLPVLSRATCPGLSCALLMTVSLCLLPVGLGIGRHHSPFLDPDCPTDCSWIYSEDGIRQRQFCEMIPDRQDGLAAEVCHNPFRPSDDVNNRVSPPEKFVVTEYTKKFTSSDGSQDSEQYTCLRILYQINKFTAQRVKGLQVSLRGLSIEDLNKFYCVNLNFSSSGLHYYSVVDEDEEMADMSFSCFCGLKPGGPYNVTIRTMPVDIIGNSSHNTLKHTKFTPLGCDVRDKSNDVRCIRSEEADWGPQCISVKQDISTLDHQGNYNILEVSFEEAPASFCFDVYDVHVYRFDTKELVDSVRIKMSSVSPVTGVCTESYNTTVPFVTARFDVSQLNYNKEHWPPITSTTFYAAIHPDPQKCKKCKTGRGDTIECKFTFSTPFTLIEDPCRDNPCGEHGEGKSVEEACLCDCQPGYMFWEDTCEVDPCQTGMNHTNPCGNGECIYTPGRDNFYCSCDDNYLEVGKTCLADPCTKNPETNATRCGVHGRCNLTLTNDSVSYNCVCDPGYSIQDEEMCKEVSRVFLIVMVTVGSFTVGIFLFTLLLCYLKRISRFCRPKGPGTLASSDDMRVHPRRQSSEWTETRVLIPEVRPNHDILEDYDRQRVLPLFSIDHPKHKTAVVNLCRFLQVHCRCNMVLMDWERSVGPTVEMWLTREIERADVVLLLCSKGTGLKYEARAKQEAIPSQSVSEYGDVFVKALTLLDDYFSKNNANDKFVVAYFDYSTKDDIPVTFRRFATYPLMQCIEGLFLRIHRVKDSPRSTRRALGLDRYRELELGQPLYDAIKAMKDEIKSDRAWYQTHNRRHSADVLQYYDRHDSGLSHGTDDLYTMLSDPHAGLSDQASSGRGSDDFDEKFKEFKEFPRSGAGPSVQDAAAEAAVQLLPTCPEDPDLPQTQLFTGNMQPRMDSGFRTLSVDDSSPNDLCDTRI